MKHFLPGFSLFVFVVFSKAQVSLQINIPPIVPNSDATIEVKIKKGAVSNFAKYQIDVPAGVYISEGDNKTGSFSFENNRAKIIWVSIPPEPEFVITMKLNPGSATGMGTITQKFYYLDGGTRKEVDAEPVSVNFSGGGPAVSSTNAAPVDANTSSPPAVVPEPIAPATSSPAAAEISTSAAGNNTIAEIATDVSPVENLTPASPAKESTVDAIKKLKEQFDAANAPAEAKTKESTPVAASPAAASPAHTAVLSGMSYKIQIGAYGERPGMGKYSSLKGVNVVKEDNFYKVLVGNFKTREEANKKKEELISKGFKGFVVTYENGSRVK